MSEIWLIGDPHFGHDKNQHGYGGIVFHAKRKNPFTLQPFVSIDEHDQFIEDQWNKTVNGKDYVYIHGDFAWRNHNHYIGALKGKKILITGSHDRMNQDSIRLFTEYHEGMLVRTLAGVPFVMTHCAMKVWERSHYGAVNTYAHSHGRLEEHDDNRSMDVGVDVSLDYTPFNLDFVIYKMSLKKKIERNRSSEELDAIVLKNKQDNIALMEKFKSIQPSLPE